MKYLLFLSWLLIITNPTLAQTKKAVKPVKAVTKELPTRYIMRDVLNSFNRLIPYMASEFKFRDPSNEPKIMANLINLNQAFHYAHENKKLNSPSFSPTLQVMQKHMSETTSSFLGRHKIFAYNRLKSTVSLCISCHSHLPESHVMSIPSLMTRYDSHKFKNKYEYANFLLVLRKYKKALRYFEFDINDRLDKASKMSSAFPKTSFIDPTLSSALKKILIINTKYFGNPNGATSFLKRVSRHNGLPKILREQIGNWLRQIKVLGSEKWSKNNKNSPLNIDQMISKVLIPIEKEGGLNNYEELNIKLLFVSGIISRYLEGNKNKTGTAAYLYWLSKGERQLARHYLFNIADVYLKDCITKFSKDPYAKKCFKEYEENLIFGYSGSAGTNIPEEEKKELERLKKIVF